MQYTVRDPQGNSRIIEGPDGASDDEIIAHAKDLFGESGGMPSNSSPIDTFRKFYKAGILGTVMQPIISKTPLGMVANAAFPPSSSGSQTPQQSFQADQLGNPDTSVNDFLMAKGAIEAPAAIEAAGGAIESLASGAKNKFQSIMDILKAPGEAEKLAPTTTELADGLTSKDALRSMRQTDKAASDALYAPIPKDVRPALPKAQGTLDTILNETKGLTPAAQKEAGNVVGNYQAFVADGKASLGDIMTEMSRLKTIATEGDGVEKLYAARLAKAMQADVDAFSASTLVKGTPIPPSQQPEEFAQDLRGMWKELTDQTRQKLTVSDATQEGAYTTPSILQPATPPITNSDIGAQIQKANENYKQFMELQNHPVTQALYKARPEEMAAQIFKRGNVQDVQVAQHVLGDAFKNQQGQWFAQVKGMPNIGAYLGKQSPEFLQSAFTPSQLTNLQRLAQFGELVKKAKFALKVGGAAGAVTAYEKLH